MTPESSLAAALLAIYVTLSLPVLFIAFKHGFKGLAIIGWTYLFLFCSIRVVGGAMQINDPESTAAAIISSVGLSPLLLAAGGILHEASYYRRFGQQNPANNLTDRGFLALTHVLITGGVALLAKGASGLTSDTTPDEIHRDTNLAKVGMVLLLLGYLAVTIVTLVTFMGSRSPSVGARAGEGPAQAARDSARLLFACVVAAPFLGIRVVASLVYFLGSVQSLNPVTGSIGLRVGVEIIEELIVALIFIGAGMATRNIRRAASKENYGIN